MKVIQILRSVFLVLVLVLPLMLYAQDGKVSKKQKKAEQKKEQRIQNAKKAEIKGKKRHIKLQDKETRKRMKKNKRKGDAFVSRRPGFFQRLFKPFK